MSVQYYWHTVFSMTNQRSFMQPQVIDRQNINQNSNQL